jgi:hypothetical protein
MQPSRDKNIAIGGTWQIITEVEFGVIGVIKEHKTGQVAICQPITSSLRSIPNALRFRYGKIAIVECGRRRSVKEEYHRWVKFGPLENENVSEPEADLRFPTTTHPDEREDGLVVLGIF